MITPSCSARCHVVIHSVVFVRLASDRSAVVTCRPASISIGCNKCSAAHAGATSASQTIQLADNKWYAGEPSLTRVADGGNGGRSRLAAASPRAATARKTNKRQKKGSSRLVWWVVLAAARR